MATYKIATGVDATNTFTTDAIKLIRSYDWNVILIPSGLDANYKVTLEVSDDNVNFVTYKLDAQTMPFGENSIIFDSLLAGEYFRVSYDPDANSTGTITMTLNVKYK